MRAVQYCAFESKEEDRIVIAPADHKDYWHCNHYRGAYAESWLDAKERMGFELTATQKWMLDEQKRRAA